VTGSIEPYTELNLKRDIEAGREVGPRMHVTGPYITGQSDMRMMHQVTTPEAARRIVAYWAVEGATWFKLYTTISRPVIRNTTGLCTQGNINSWQATACFHFDSPRALRVIFLTRLALTR